MSLLRVVLLGLLGLGAAAGGHRTVLPTVARAAEADAVLPSTYSAILVCDADIRREIYGEAGSAGTLASIQAALSAVEDNAPAAPQLRPWAAILRDGRDAVQAAGTGAARRSALKALLQDMAPMVEAARHASRSG